MRKGGHPIKTIFFDAAGTLFTVSGSVGEIYAGIAREHGKDVSRAALEAGFRRCFAAAPPMAFPDVEPERISTLEKQWWKTLVHDVFAALGPFPAFDDYFEALFAFFARTDAWKLYPETLTVLEQLEHRGLSLGVISNFDSRLFGLLDGLGVARFFDPVVISTQAGAAKPERAIFARALALAGARAEETLHVGDSHEADLAGALAAGLTPVLVDRRAQDQRQDGYFTINNLMRLLEIVES